jgi:hypothetical protein
VRNVLVSGSLALVLGALVVAPVSGSAAEVEVTVVGGTASDPSRAAVLADWNSPLGRLSWFVASEQARMMRGGQPGSGPYPAIRVAFQDGLPPRLVGAAVDAGIDLGQPAITAIPWPWDEAAQEHSLPLADQLTVLLGQRLRPASP